MSEQTITSTSPTAASGEPQNRVSGELRCALTGKPITAEEAYWAPPLVTAKELIGTLATTAVRAPGNLGHILFDEQPNVPYAPEARQQLGSRRSVEQLKLLLFVLLIAAVIFAPIYMLAMG